MTTYDADGEDVDLLDHLLSKQRRHAERRSSSQEMLPAIKMLVGDWYIDELGVMTREITARETSWSKPQRVRRLSHVSELGRPRRIRPARLAPTAKAQGRRRSGSKNFCGTGKATATARRRLRSSDSSRIYGPRD